MSLSRLAVVVLLAMMCDLVTAPPLLSPTEATDHLQRPVRRPRLQAGTASIDVVAACKVYERVQVIDISAFRLACKRLPHLTTSLSIRKLLAAENHRPASPEG
jgi:hypothetical protein